MGSYNLNSVMRKVLKSSKFQTVARRKVQQEANNIKKSVLKYYNNHPITKQLDNGPDPDESKNLFGFIGFEKNERPTEKVRIILENSFQVRVKPFNQTSRSYSFLVRWPSDEALENAAQMPWGLASSWLKAVEEGIPGLARYLSKKAGRSGAGVQVESNIRRRYAEFEPRPYILAKLKELRKSTNNARAVR